MPHQSNEQNKTLSKLISILHDSSKPNYVLIVKVSDEPKAKSTATHIRRLLFTKLTSAGWKSQNMTTSQFYYRRSDSDSDVVRESGKVLIEKVVNDIQSEYASGGTSWGVNFIILKPLEYRIVPELSFDLDESSEDDEGEHK